MHYWLHYTDLPGEARKSRFSGRRGRLRVASLPSSPSARRSPARWTTTRASPPTAGTSPEASPACSFSASSLLRVPPGSGRPLAAAAAALFARRLLPPPRCWRRAPATCCSRNPVRLVLEPYYYVQTRPQPMGLEVWFNSTFLQLAIDFTDADPARRVEQERAFEKWSAPTTSTASSHGGASPRRVLVLGAGTGTTSTWRCETAPSA